MNETKREGPPTPALDKLHAVHEKSQVVGEFLVWLNEQGIQLAKGHEHTEACNGPLGCGLFSYDRHPALYTVTTGIEKLLAGFFQIDLDAVERERQAVLEYLRGRLAQEQQRKAQGA